MEVRNGLVLVVVGLFCAIVVQGNILYSDFESYPNSEDFEMIDINSPAIFLPQKASECSGENYTTCFDRLLEYIQMGLDEIQLSDETSATIVVGLSGAGKSTLVQFIGNSSNSLVAVCRGRSCNITDDSGSVGDSIVSKTFLPNLVHDDIDLMPYYDMPGFNDNRNEVMDIANSFFVRQVLEHAEKIKIIVVARDATFTIADRVSFPALLKSLLKLIKNPAKFANGLALISNMVDYDDSDEDCFIDYYDFFLDLEADIDTLFDPVDHVNARALISILIETHTPNNHDLANVGIMRTPEQNGSIRLDAQFAEDYVNIRTLFDSTAFVDCVLEDFGFAISPEAVVFLQYSTHRIFSELESIFATVASDIQNWFKIAYEDLLTGKMDYSIMQEVVSALENANYDDVNVPDMKPSWYINRIINSTLPFATEFLDPHLDTLNSRMIFLDYISKATSDFEVDFNRLIRELEVIELNVENFVASDLSQVVAASVLSATLEISNGVVLEFSTNLLDITNLDDFDSFNSSIYALRVARYDNCNSNNAQQCLVEVLSNVIEFASGSHHNFIEILESVSKFVEFCLVSANINLTVQTTTWPTELIRILPQLVLFSQENVTLKASQEIASTVRNFAEMSKQKFINSFRNISLGQEIDMVKFNASVTTLKQIALPSCAESTLLPMPCSNEIQQQINWLDPELSVEYSVIVERKTRELQFCLEDLNAPANYDFMSWPPPLLSLHQNIIDNVTDFAIIPIINNIHQQLQVFTNNFADTVIKLQNIATDIELKLQGLQRTSSKTFEAKSTLEALYGTPNAKLSDYLIKTIDLYSELADVGDSETLELALLYVLENFQQLPWKQILWLPIHETGLINPVNQELQFAKILIALRVDLTSFVVQSERTGQLHSWWTNTGVVNQSTWNALWQKASMALPTLEATTNLPELDQLLGNSVERQSRLNDLLDLTLLSQPSCPAAGSVDTFFVGNYLSLKQLLQCNSSFSSTRSLNILALDAVYIDTDITGTHFNRVSNLNLTIIAPTWYVVGQKEFDLSGAAGPNGRSHQRTSLKSPGANATGQKAASGSNGEQAGIFYGIYLHQKLGSGSLLHDLQGGKGGQGALGSDGADGTRGSKKSFSPSSHCEAVRNGGDIRVTVHPNSCSTSSSYCNANNNGNGQRVSIYGTDGTDGSPGEDGGNGGQGGSGGSWLLINLEKQVPEQHVNGTSGQGGNGGIGGRGGRGGRNGNTLIVPIMWIWGCSQSRCEERGSRSEVVPDDRKDGDSGATGSSGGASPSRSDQRLSDYAGLVRQSKVLAEGMKENEFVNLLLENFLEKLSGHSQVPPTLSFGAKSTRN